MSDLDCADIAQVCCVSSIAGAACGAGMAAAFHPLVIQV